MTLREFLRKANALENNGKYWVKFIGTNRNGEIAMENGHSVRRIPAEVIDAEVLKHTSEVNFAMNKVYTVEIDAELPTLVEYHIHGNTKYGLRDADAKDAADDVVDIYKKFSSLWEAELWVIDNIPSIYFGLNISNGYGDFLCGACREFFGDDDVADILAAARAGIVEHMNDESVVEEE